MDSFALNLSSAVINLEYLKKRVLENPKTASKMCYCRRELLENYTSVMQTFLVKAASRVLKYLEDENSNFILDTSDLRDWYYEAAYEKFYTDPKISNKMVLMFRVLQELLDANFFEELNRALSDIAERKSSEATSEVFNCLLNKLFSKVRIWYEVFTFNVISIRIDCRSISEELFNVYNVPKDSPFCDEGKGQDCKNCSLTTSRENRCILHETVLKDGEKINLILTKEMIDAPGWIESFYALFAEFHKDTKQITLCADYRLFDDHNILTYTQQNYNRILLAKEIFGKVKIVNSEFVDFGQFYSVVQDIIES